MATRKLEVVITGDASSLEKALGKAGDSNRNFAKTLGKAGVAGAIVGLGAAVKIGVGEFMEAQKVTAQTNAVLKSTGAVAGTTTEQVQKLSEALMLKSGVDDEAIQSGQNMLLTFTKVRNEVGAGNDVFDQATKATLDLSVAMGKDMSSSAVLVGKALNDPIKGIGALSRVGVQLDADQKKLIKTMVAAGDTMGAQKIILKELETQFGGSAEAAGKTFGGQVNIAKQRLSNFAGEMVEKSIPVLQGMALVITEDVIPVLRRFYNWFEENILPTLRTLGALVKTTWDGIAKVLKDNEPALTRLAGHLEKVGNLMLWLTNKVVIPVLKPMLTEFLPTALGFAIKAFDKLAAAIEAVVDGIKWLIDNIPKIPTPKVPGWLDPRNIGDPRNPNMGHPGAGSGGINLMGAHPSMMPFAVAAQGLGLQVTSGLRPGAITANGTPSDHGVGKALDVAGSSSAMAAFFKALLGNRSVKQAFYDPLGSIFGGAWSSYREGGHSDHVHVATYDTGGVLKPGWTMAYNGTGRNEYVSKDGGGPYYLVLPDGRVLAELVRSEDAKYARRNAV